MPPAHNRDYLSSNLRRPTTRSDLLLTELYYEHPVNVRYWDAGRKIYIRGIAYQDFVICGCCGKACSIADIIKEAAEIDNIDADNAIIERVWIPIA